MLYLVSYKQSSGNMEQVYSSFYTERVSTLSIGKLPL